MFSMENNSLSINQYIVTKKNIGMIVFVTGFQEATACYLIDENPDRAGGNVIPYEKAEECCKPKMDS